MAISFTSINCPACSAELSVESGRAYSFCSYCGTKVLINNENEHIYRNIDEARIKEAETDRMIRLRELELEEMENARGRKGVLVAYGLALFLAMIGMLIWSHNAFAGIWCILIGVCISMFAHLSTDEKKKKRRTYVNPNEVQITEDMIYYREKNFNSINMLFMGAGFTNVTCIPLNDLNIFTQKRNGQVESVTINGSEEFEEGDIFPKASNVLITYHSRN